MSKLSLSLYSMAGVRLYLDPYQKSTEIFQIIGHFDALAMGICFF